MNPRIASIFERVRDTLNDPKGDRWHDYALFRLLQDCLMDMSLHSNAFNTESLVPLSYGRAVYDLPKNNYHLKGVLYAGQDLPVYSISQMRALFGNNWRLHATKTSLKCIVKENLDNTKFQVYPRPFYNFLCPNDLPESDGTDFGLVSIDSCQDFGVLNSVYSEDKLIYLDDFGVVSDKSKTDTLVVIYTKNLTIDTLVDELETPPIYDKAFKHYITGHALRNDLSESNRAVGMEELQFYQRELQNLIILSTKNNTPNNQHRTIYQGMG